MGEMFSFLLLIIGALAAVMTIERIAKGKIVEGLVIFLLCVFLMSEIFYAGKLIIETDNQFNATFEQLQPDIN